MKLIIDIPDREYKQRTEFPLCYDSTIDKAIANGTPLEEELEKIRAEIKEKIEQEEFARSVFRHEEKDTVKAEQCTGSIMAYKNVIILFDKYKAESEEPKGENK